LLLVAHLRRVRLPITDYVNDLKSALDQVPRLLNAMIDIATEDDRPVSMMHLIDLSQAIAQVNNYRCCGLWFMLI